MRVVGVRSDNLSGRDTLTRKGAKAENVNTFRTIPFDDWLRLFMHVESSILIAHDHSG